MTPRQWFWTIVPFSWCFSHAGIAWISGIEGRDA